MLTEAVLRLVRSKILGETLDLLHAHTQFLKMHCRQSDFINQTARLISLGPASQNIPNNGARRISFGFRAQR